MVGLLAGDNIGELAGELIDLLKIFLLLLIFLLLDSLLWKLSSRNDPTLSGDFLGYYEASSNK